MKAQQQYVLQKLEMLSKPQTSNDDEAVVVNSKQQQLSNSLKVKLTNFNNKIDTTNHESGYHNDNNNLLLLIELKEIEQDTKRKRKGNLQL